ncbi:hypothetical protein C8J56DRAFT_1049179 [Mycena floridula]|nr:hypothetical protein C8J56DRAFT_1049179 [Mycena floridula]
MVTGCTYCVKSQSSSYHYDVDLNAYHCSCLSFLLINFCKHLCAIQLHFTAVPDVPTSLVFRTAVSDDLATSESDSDSDNDDASDDITDITPTDTTILSGLVDKLQSLSIRTRLNLPLSLTPTLEALNTAIENALSELGQSATDNKVLPPKKKVTPHAKNEWTATKSVMGVSVKTAKKRTHINAYSGSERSGKDAAPDARVPLKKAP